MARYRPPVKSRIPHFFYMLGLGLGIVVSGIVAYNIFLEDMHPFHYRAVAGMVFATVATGALTGLGIVGVIDGLLQLFEITAQNVYDLLFPSPDD